MVIPKTYKEDPEYFNVHAYRYALLGATNFELGKNFGIAETTFETWLQKFPKLQAAVLRGREDADAEVALTLHKRATGKWKQKATKIMQYEGRVITEDYIERFAPDVSAIKYWLNNRQPKRWKERVSNEHSGPDGEPMKIARIEHVVVDPKA